MESHGRGGSRPSFGNKYLTLADIWLPSKTALPRTSLSFALRGGALCACVLSACAACARLAGFILGICILCASVVYIYLIFYSLSLRIPRISPTTVRECSLGRPPWRSIFSLAQDFRLVVTVWLHNLFTVPKLSARVVVGARTKALPWRRSKAPDPLAHGRGALR